MPKQTKARSTATVKRILIKLHQGSYKRLSDFNRAIGRCKISDQDRTALYEQGEKWFTKNAPTTKKEPIIVNTEPSNLTKLLLENKASLDDMMPSLIEHYDQMRITALKYKVSVQYIMGRLLWIEQIVNKVNQMSNVGIDKTSDT